MAERVLIVGGSEEYTGALYLAGVAALRAGAESVVVMAPEKVAWILNALSPDLVTRKLKGKYLALSHLARIRKQLTTADVLVLGNGATTHPGTAALMRSLSKWPGQKIIDADALKALRGSGVRNAILTPNEGEWKLLEKHCDIEKLLASNVIIKKGFPTSKGEEILRPAGSNMPTQIWTSDVHISVRTNKGLAKAGTGDVLAGLCAGYVARGLPLFAAAKAACTTGNAVADILAKKSASSGNDLDFLASDILRELKKKRRQ